MTTGNPEEGELRPQLLDRFGMHAEIRTVKDANLRVQIVEQVGEVASGVQLLLTVPSAVVHTPRVQDR
jgi:Mg-chelatase subunit ChlI